MRPGKQRVADKSLARFAEVEDEVERRKDKYQPGAGGKGCAHDGARVPPRLWEERSNGEKKKIEKGHRLDQGGDSGEHAGRDEIGDPVVVANQGAEETPRRGAKGKQHE